MVIARTTFGPSVFKKPRFSFATKLRIIISSALSSSDGNSLCAEVRQRFSLLSSSWGYSRARCRELVGQGAAADRTTLEEIKRLYIKGAVTLRNFLVERNGNGRDFDIIPFFAGGYAHGYVLRFEIVQPDTRKETALLHSSGYYVDGNSNLRVFLRQDEIRKRFPDFALDHTTQSARH